MSSPCPKCGNTHDRCAGHRKTDGKPCARLPHPGSTVCVKHGGGAPQVRRAAAARLDKANALKEAAMFVQSRDIDPITALLETVQFTAGEVDYWRAKVADLDEDDVAGMGVTKTEVGEEKGQPTNLVTREATEHLYVRLLHEATDRLAKYASLALRAGCEERRVRLAEQQGAMVAIAVRRILDALDLSPAQQELIPTVVPRELRALANPAQETM